MMSPKNTQEISAFTKKLASYIAEASENALPAEVLECTKHHLLDTLAAAVSGAGLLPGRMGIAYVKQLGGRREATVIGSRFLTNTVNAACANGMSAHADETDDSHAPSLTHPGCAIVPAALALAEREGRNGLALLNAVALGYDISARFSFSLRPYEYRSVGHSTHSIAPTFGAAAAAAALLLLDAAQVRHVLSYSAQQASGLSCYTRDIDHIEKAFDFGGMPARNGVTAATMVAAGFTAVDDVLAGERSFFVANNEEQRIGLPPLPELLVQDLGKTFEVMNTNIKRWSVGSPIQAPLDSLFELIRTEHVKSDDVKDMAVRVSQLGANTTDNADMPDICMQHMCAVMLIDGIVTFDSSHDLARMQDPKVLELRRRIELIGDEELQNLLPERHGIVELRLGDGRVLRHHTPAVRGSAQNPMTRTEVDEKCFHLLVPSLGEKRSRQLCDAVWNIDQMDDVRVLRPLLQA